MAKPRKSRKNTDMNQTETTAAETAQAATATEVTETAETAEADEQETQTEQTAQTGDNAPAAEEAPATTEAAAVEETVEETAPPAVEPQKTAAPILDTLIDPRLKMAHDLLSEQFEGYCTAMQSGKPIANEATGAQHQLRLWRIIDGVLRKQGNEFGALFTQLLTLFEREHGKNGVLSPRLRYRFFGALPLGADEARSFEAILAALLTVCEGRSRSLKLKQVDFNKAFARYADKTALARVTDYFDI